MAARAHTHTIPSADFFFLATLLPIFPSPASLPPISTFLEFFFNLSRRSPSSPRNRTFLNIGEDHSSPVEHPDLEDYRQSKLLICKQAKTACISMDCDHAPEVAAAAARLRLVVARPADPSMTVLPARAGMSPWRTAPCPGSTGAPRASGDEPTQPRPSGAVATCSPRERG